MARDAAAPWAEQVLMTADDLMALPEDAWHYELVQGRLVRTRLSSFERGVMGGRLATALAQFIEERGTGAVAAAQTGFLVSKVGEPDTVLAPDLAFVSPERVPAPGTREWRGFPRLAPDLVVEIASPSQHRPQMEVKARLWLDAGAELVWVIWPGLRQLDVWKSDPAPEMRTLEDSDALDGESVLPGFTFPIAGLWTEAE